MCKSALFYRKAIDACVLYSYYTFKKRICQYVSAVMVRNGCCVERKGYPDDYIYCDAGGSIGSYAALQRYFRQKGQGGLLRCYGSGIRIYFRSEVQSRL